MDQHISTLRHLELDISSTADIDILKEISDMLYLWLGLTGNAPKWKCSHRHPRIPVLKGVPSYVFHFWDMAGVCTRTNAEVTKVSP
jgi:hypothetical protein